MWYELAFWCCGGILAYTYLGYPLLVHLLAIVLRREVQKADLFPQVSVVIAAFNEEADIRATILNKLTQEYPPERLSVTVVSDGSTDQTDTIVADILRQHPTRVFFLRQEPRQGKTAALNLAFQAAKADVIVIADANSIYDRQAVRTLVACFADATVGYVTGRLTYVSPNSSGFGKQSGRYIQYENLLRSAETRIGSVVGVNGGIDAIRRPLFVPMRPDQLPDFILPLKVIEQRSRVVYQPDAVLYEPALASPHDEFRMRVRVTLRALWALYDQRHLFNSSRYPLFSWQLLSHKLLRYLAFIPLFGMLAFNAFALASASPYFMAFFGIQIAVYAFAALGYVLAESTRTPSFLLLPHYFLVLNCACAYAAYQFLRRRKIVVWQPRKGV